MAMIVEFDIPAVVRALVSRSSREKHFICKVPGRADIREVSSAEAPMAGVVIRKDGKSKYRSFDGEIYAVVGRFSDLRNGVGNKRFLRRTGVEDMLFRRAQLELSQCARTSVNHETLQLSTALLPTERSGKFDLGDAFKNSKIEHLWRSVTSAGELKLSPDGETDASRWLDLANAALDKVFICEESVWLRVPDPCIALFPSNLGMYTVQGDAGFYTQKERRPGFNEPLDIYWRDIQDLCLPIFEGERARSITDEHLSRLQSKNVKVGSTVDIQRIEIFNPEAFSFDFESAEFRRLADRVSYLGSAALRVPSRPSIWKKRVPTEFIEAIAQLDTALMNDADGGRDTEIALEYVLDMVFRQESSLEAAGLRCQTFGRAIERGLERWADRPITLSTTPHSNAEPRIGRQ
jgi:hypothetical protein